MYLLADVHIMYDLLKIRNVSEVNMSLNQICLENVHEDKMKASNNEVNYTKQWKKKVGPPPFVHEETLLTININSWLTINNCSMNTQRYSIVINNVCISLPGALQDVWYQNNTKEN